jgi:beta-phosphoglucomutase-like phosphatase (HAD superfamily)
VQHEAFFFDFDGVLADSVEVKTEAFAKPSFMSLTDLKL